MNKNKIGVLASCALLAVTLAACGKSSSSSTSTSASSSSATISGAGSTFAAPVYQQWGSGISGLTVNYNPVGSGAGITALEGKTVDFGASDPPLKPADFATLEKVGPVQQIPMFLGAITVSYNLPGVKSGLKLDGPTIAEIFLGKIKTWNDPAIAGLNPGVTLPSTPITVIHRSDSSGTTSGFTGFLASVESGMEEQGRRRQDRAVAHGHRRQGQRRRRRRRAADDRRCRLRRAVLCAGAQIHLRQRQEQGRQLHRTDARLDQRGGRRGRSAGQPRHQDQKPRGSPTAYPITSQTFVVVYKDMCKAGVPGGESAAKGVVKFLEYGLGSGQSILSQADYAALPAAILTKSKEAVTALQCNGAPIAG